MLIDLLLWTIAGLLLLWLLGQLLFIGLFEALWWFSYLYYKLTRQPLPFHHPYRRRSEG